MKKQKFFAVVVMVLFVSSGLFAGGKTETNSGKPVLRVLGGYNANHDPNNDPSQKAIEERTGYKVEYYMLPQDNAAQNLNMEIASGSSYDIVMTGPYEFYTLAAQNALLPLDEMLAGNGPNLLKFIAKESWNLARVDGKIYAVPMLNERPNIEGTILFRKDVLDGLGLAVPATPAAFRNVLRAVKEKRPDMIPFTTQGGVFIETLVSGFGFYFDWNERNGKLVHYVALPEYREYLAFLRQLYQEGLIDTDLAVNKAVNVDEKFSSGKAFAIPSGWFGAANQVPALYANVPGAVVGYLDPLANAQGAAKIRANRYLNKVSYIPKTAKNPLEAIRFMNAKLDPAIFTYITLGTEGQTFTVEQGNRYLPIMPIFTELRNNAWWYLNGIDEVKYADMWLARTRRNPELGKAFDAVNANYDKYAVIKPTALMPTLESVAKYSQALGKAVSDYEIQVIAGIENLANYDAFQRKWLADGGQEMTNAVNEWYSSVK